jgi:hypothetical protein
MVNLLKIFISMISGFNLLSKESGIFNKLSISLDEL